MKLIVLLLLFGLFPTFAQSNTTWRAANAKELKACIPERAKVEQENIETEFRTASAVTNGKGRFIGGAVLITAGYAADGKYAQLFITQVAIKVGDVSVAPGTYLLGQKRLENDAMEVKIYEAETGKLVGTANATRQSKSGAIRSLLITPPTTEKGMLQIGRFGVAFTLGK